MERAPFLLVAILAAATATLCVAQQPPDSQPASAPGAPDAAPSALPAPGPPAPAGPPKSVFKFDELAFDLGLDAEYQRRVVTQDTRGTWTTHWQQTDIDRIFKETVGFKSSGSILDERILQYDAAVRWGLSQESYLERRPGPNLDENPHGQILEYDLRARILPAGKVTGTVYASEVQGRLPRPFLPSLDRTTERAGAELVFNDRVLPMRLSYEHSFESLSSPQRYAPEDDNYGNDTLHFEATWQPSEYHSLQLSYDYYDRREQYSGSRTTFDTLGNYLTLDHQWQFGDDHKSRLQTLARLQDETGDLGRDIYEFSPQLRLQHTQTLATFYKFQYLQETFQELRTRQWRGDIGLTHELAQTLTSTGNFYGLKQESDPNADASEWGGLTNFAFNRENSLGQLSANLSYIHSENHTDDGRGAGVVIAEAVTFHDPLVVYLAQRDIARWSIILTDSARSRTYRLGRDYVVVQLGEFTALQRVPTGQIVDNQTVYASYTYKTASNYTLRRDRVDFRVQQNFKFGLTPYFAASLQNEHLDPNRYETFTARNVHRYRVGATYRQPRWSAGGEYEYNYDSVDPYQALHFNGDVTLLQLSNQQLGAQGTLSRFFFDGTGEPFYYGYYGAEVVRAHDTTLLDLGLNYRYLVAQSLEANGTALYRFEDDSIQGRTNGVDLTGSVAYRFGLFSVLFEIEYKTLDLPGSTDESLAVWLKLRREIPVIARQP